MRPHQRKPLQLRKTFAIIADGECEVWYFQMLKRNERDLPVTVAPPLPQKKPLKDQFALAKSLSADYTRVFWIIDFDVIESETRGAKKGTKTLFQSFIEYKKEIAKNYENVVIMVNNPCLEFWLLLHFESTCRSFNDCTAAQRQLKNIRRIMPRPATITQRKVRIYT